MEIFRISLRIVNYNKRNDKQNKKLLWRNLHCELLNATCAKKIIARNLAQRIAKKMPLSGNPTLMRKLLQNPGFPILKGCLPDFKICIPD